MKHFLVILGITALVWLGLSLSEERDYPMKVGVQMTGYDTIRYAIVSADTVLDVKARMSGANAMLYSIQRRIPVLRVPVPEDGSAVATNSLIEPLKRVAIGIKQVSCDVDSLRVKLAPRSSRTYVPQLDDVNFTFNEQYGLYGEAVMTPSQVTLYGPAESLAAIDEVHIAAANLRDIKESDTYTLPLDPVWENYPDVHPSCTEVSIYLPVEAYVERDFRVPVRVLDADTTVSYKLYPEEVTVRAWVAQRDLNNAPDFVVSVDYSDLFQHDGILTPQLMEFPAYVRPRYIYPREIQCVVIR